MLKQITRSEPINRDFILCMFSFALNVTGCEGQIFTGIGAIKFLTNALTVEIF
jgi:hypothetical protein